MQSTQIHESHKLGKDPLLYERLVHLNLFIQWLPDEVTELLWVFGSLVL